MTATAAASAISSLDNLTSIAITDAVITIMKVAYDADPDKFNTDQALTDAAGKVTTVLRTTNHKLASHVLTIVKADLKKTPVDFSTHIITTDGPGRQLVIEATGVDPNTTATPTSPSADAKSAQTPDATADKVVPFPSAAHPEAAAPVAPTEPPTKDGPTSTDAKPAETADDKPEEIPPLPALVPSGLADMGLNQALVTPLNSLLEQVTGGKVKDIGAVLAALKTAEDTATEAVHKYNRMRLRVGGPAVLKLPTQKQNGTDIPNGKVVMKSGQDIFGIKHPLLDLEVPTFVWDFPHPKVPEKRFYLWNVRTLSVILRALAKGKNYWLVGHSGCGKTTLQAQVAARLGWPAEFINLDGHMLRSDLVGTKSLVSTEKGVVTDFLEGVLVRALENGYLTTFDEFSLGDPDLMYVIQRVLEGRGLNLLEDGGRHIAPNQFYRNAAACNTIGQGAQDALYQGTKAQSIATLDRMTNWIQVEYLNAQQEFRLIMENVKTADQAFVQMLCTFAHDARSAFMKGEISQAVSPRTTIEIAEFATDYWNPAKPAESINFAFTYVLWNRCNPTDHTTLKRLYDLRFNGAAPQGQGGQTTSP